MPSVLWIPSLKSLWNDRIEMKVFYVMLNICCPTTETNVIPIYIETNGFISMFYYAFFISSPSNLVCGFISKLCILDISFSCVGIASTFSCSWILCDLFSSWPLPLRSCGNSDYTSSSWSVPFLWSCDSSIYTSSSWTIPFLSSCDSLICISSSWAVPLGLAFVSSSWPDTLVLVEFP